MKYREMARNSYKGCWVGGEMLEKNCSKLHEKNTKIEQRHSIKLTFNKIQLGMHFCCKRA